MSALLSEDYLALVGRGLLMTVFVSTFVIIASNILALGIAIYMLRSRPTLGPLVVAYSFFARAAPALAILFALYYGLPRAGIYLDPLSSALIGLTFASTAYNYEFLRSGFAGIPAAQREAALALGLRPWTTLRRVLLPQAYAAAAPSLFSNAIQMVKGSSLASLVAINELTAASITMVAETYRAIEVLLAISLIYLGVSSLILICQFAYERSQRWLHLARH